ncbi:MAG: hypothetical protein RLZZ618_4158 [Pseudomonadota bacterium]
MARTARSAPPSALNAASDSHPAALLDSVVERSTSKQAPPAASGIAVGRLDGFDDSGLPIVSIAQLGATVSPSQSMVLLEAAHVGQHLAIGFEGGDRSRPLVLGLMMGSARPLPPTALVDGERVVLQAEHEIELRCGDAAIVLSADGRITVRGTYITSHASATQRILGGSVNVN